MAQEALALGQGPETLPDAPASAPAKQAFRSFKKKYAKMKLKFELGIRENERLIREELRIEDLSKRIQEQNDQLLEVLLEFNDSLHVTPALRFGLDMPGDPDFSSNAEPPIDALISDSNLARKAWSEAKEGIASGSLSPNAYRQVEKSIKRNKDFSPAQQYNTLSNTPRLTSNGVDNSIEKDGLDRKLGYFTPEHETEFYLALDAKLGDDAAALQLERIPEPPTLAEREKEAILRNPASMVNWLRRNQPATMQDQEVASEKSASRPSNQRSSKRAPAQRKDEDAIDEDSMDVEPTPKGKRKREEDAGYRPKGGNNRSKKKKEDTTPKGKKPY